MLVCVSDFPSNSRTSCTAIKNTQTANKTARLQQQTDMDHFIGFAGGGGRRSAGGATPSCRRRSASPSLISWRKDWDGGPPPTMTLKHGRRKVDVSAGWYYAGNPPVPVGT